MLGVNAVVLRAPRRFRNSLHSRTVEAYRAYAERGNIMTVENNYDVVRRGYAAFSAGDTDTLDRAVRPRHRARGTGIVGGVG